MTKQHYTQTTPIDQAKIIPFPSNRVIRKSNSQAEAIAAGVAIEVLIKLYDMGHSHNPSDIYAIAKEQVAAKYLGGV
ncbi:MAG: hypothetical protein KKF12_12030 [Proteobacteria bacterium]|nr:hypothetical protein [Desulfobacula sp.]MBU3915245.1 hypothetical protein [bacterium]MBU4131541.1 hypothetical protein [Pseudomonadota bacterium]